MMKKILHLVAMMVMSVTLLPSTTMALNLDPNQMLMGHYLTDDLASSGWGSTAIEGLATVATDITPDELAPCAGGNIVAFRVGLFQSTPISRVFVIPVKPNGNLVMDQMVEWPCEASSQGWNMIQLETPYSLDNLPQGYSLRIGFDYEQATKSSKPLSVVKVGTTYPSYHYIDGEWKRLILSTKGNLSLQCVVENDNFPQYVVRVRNIQHEKIVKTGTEISYSFETYNLGTNSIPANGCTYEVAVDGQVINTLTNTEVLTSEPITLNGAFSTADIPAGAHTLTITPVAVNGEPLDNPPVFTSAFSTFDFGFERQMHLVEQFTSTNCTYCPQGTANIVNLTNMRDDIAWVAHHEYMSGADPFMTAQTDSIDGLQGIDGYPEGTFDRTTGLQGANIVYAVLTNLSATTMSTFLDYVESQGPSWATVYINSTFDATTRKAVVTVNGDLVPGFEDFMGEDAKLSVFLTEDGLVAAQVSGGNNYVHNNVMRLALGSIKGVNINKTSEETYKNTFEVDIPAGWNTDKMHIVAFISRPLGNALTDIYVTNAQKEKLGNANEPSSDYDFIVDGIYYHIIGNDAVMVVNAESYLDDIVISETVSYLGITYFVTSIGDFAFYGCLPLSSLTIPVSVTSIADNAFTGCGVQTICITGNGDWLAGALPSTVKTLYIGSGVTSIEGLCVNPTTIYSYASTPPSCNEMTFSGYDGTLHIPAASIASYFIADYWCNFFDVVGDAVEPLAITMSQDSLELAVNGQTMLTTIINPSNATPSTVSWQSSNKAIATVENGQIRAVAKGECDIVATCVGKQAVCHVTVIEIEPTSLTVSQDDAIMEVGQQLALTATVLPEDATNKTVVWSSTDDGIATVNEGVVTAISPGICDIIARCGTVRDTCHVKVVEKIIYITLDQHEVSVLPNHIITLTPTMTPESTNLKVTSSNPSVAAARLANGKVQVVGINEGETTVFVGSVDGTAVGDTCHVTVYTEVGDVNCDGYVNITDVTVLINYLLSGDESVVNITNADTNIDNRINISDVTTLIKYLLSGEWTDRNLIMFTPVETVGIQEVIMKSDDRFMLD